MNLPKAKLDRYTALKLWCDTHSKYAKEQVVLGNLGLVGTVLKQLNQNPQDEDFFSIGIIGLVKAVNSYKPETSFKFQTYAPCVIRNEILMTFRKKKRFRFHFHLTNLSSWMTEKACCIQI